VTDQSFCTSEILGRKWEYNGIIHQLFIDFKTTYDSVRREVLYSTVTEFGIPRKLAGLIKIHVNETYSRNRTGKNLSDKFPIQNGLKQGDAYYHCFSTFLWKMPLQNEEDL
jgi:hypothetical protein